MKTAAKILVADDDPVIVTATRRVLEAAGYTTFGAQDGQEALELAHAQPPDLMLLDVNMPRMSGFETCRRIKADPTLTGIFIILISSSYINSDSHIDGLNMGADGYLARPITNRELLAHVESILRIQEVERALQASNDQWLATFDAVSDAIFLTDAQDTILKYNRAAIKMWPHPSETLIGKKCYQAVYGAETLDSAGPLALARETKQPQTLTFANQDRWIEAKINPIFDLNGAFTGAVQTFTEITKRKQAEEALRESQAKLQAILDYSPALISIKDLTGNIILANQGLAVLDAPPLNELVGKNVFEIFPQDVAEQLWKNDLAALEARAPVRSEEVVKHRDGTWHTYLTVKFPIYQQSEQPFGICAISNDITERIKIEEALKQSEEKFRLLTEKSVFGIYIIQDAKMVYVNPGFAQAFGYTPEEIIDKLGPEDLIHPEDIQAVMRRFQNRLEGETEESNMVYKAIKNDGSIFYIEVYGMITNYRGRPAVMGTMKDITERKKAEEALRASEAFSQAILDNSPIGISVRSRSGHLLSANTAWKKIWGLPETAIQPDLAHERQTLNSDQRDNYLEAHQDEVRRVYEQGGHLHLPALEITHPRPGGAKWISQHFYAIQDAQEQVNKVVILTEDITPSKKNEEALLEYNARLETAVETRTRELREAQEQLVRQEKLAVLGQLAGSVGHELRNPLGIINNAVYFLRLVQPEAEAKVKEYLGIIETETRNADKIISDLLDFSRIKSVDIEPVPVPELLRNTLERFPAPPNVTVTLSLPENLPQIYVDPRQITQVLGNLILNACQSMPKGGQLSIKSDQISIKADPLNPKSWLQITIQDTGTGITPENMKKIFEPLFTTKSKGIGLGLAVSQKLIEANGGRIEVESEPGKGSTFTLYLPVK
jgi:PAS domain S-box-containing protein